MKISTKNLGDGRYAVSIDGRETRIIIERGEPPKYRQPQEWCVGVHRGSADRDDVEWLSYDAKGKANALRVVDAIIIATND